MSSEKDSDPITTTQRSDHPPPPPPSRWHNDDSSAGPIGGQRIRLMCSFGGRILPRPHDQQLRYVGGDTRIIAIARTASFSTIVSELSKIAGSSVPAGQISIKYQLPNEDLDALISLTSDEDVENMMEEYDRLSASRTPRLRLFLFHPGIDTASSASSAGSRFGFVFDRSGESKSDDWFLDALNGSGAPIPLERVRSEASSIVSEVPDYLFGFDNNSDETPPAATRPNFNLSEPAIADLSPLEAKPGDDFHPEPPIPQLAGYVPNPVWHYVADRVPVYYVPGPILPVGSIPVQHLPFGFAHQVGIGQAPVGYPQPVHGTPVYVGGTPMMAAAYEYPMSAKPISGEAYEMMGLDGLIRNSTVIPFYPPVGIAPAGTEPPLPASSDFMGA